MPAEPVFCTSCGNKNEADAIFCEGCGERLEAAGMAATPAAPNTAPADSPPVPPARRRPSRRLVALIVVVILVGAGLVFGEPLIRYFQLKSILASKGGDASVSDSTEVSGPVSVFATDSIVVSRPRSLEARPVVPGGGTIATGTVLTLRSSERICSNVNSAGDSFSALVQRAVAGSNGARIPKGTLVMLVVDQATTAELSVSTQSIELGNTTYQLDATVDTVELKSSDPDGLRLMPSLPPGSPPGAVVMRSVGPATGDRCIEPNALIRITLREDLVLMP